MKTVIFLVILSLCTPGFAQKTNTLYGEPSDIAPISVNDLALYPGKNKDFKHTPSNNLTAATYPYNGKDYYLQPSKNGYLLHTSKKAPSHSVMRLKKVGNGNGFLFIDDTGSSSYAYFDRKSNLIIEFYDRKTKKVEQLKIIPKINKKH